MEPSKIFLTAALAAASTLAHADASWEFAIHGSGLFANGGVEGCSPDNPDQCTHAIDWIGSVTFFTDSAADGVYDAGHPIDDGWAPGGIVRMTMTSNVGSSDIDAQAIPGFNILPGVYPYAITISGGHVTDIQWYSQERPDGLGVFQVTGFGATYDTSSYHGAFAQVTGTLTAVPVPEPAPLALSLLGLAALGAGLRRRPLRRDAARPA